MKVLMDRIILSTKAKRELVDITHQVERIVSGSEMKNGLCLVSAPHATAAVVANENEAGLVSDILKMVDELFPQSKAYLHNRIDDNATSHLAATLLGSSKAFPVQGGRIVRGTWQNIFLFELDGPRGRREVDVQLVGE